MIPLSVLMNVRVPGDWQVPFFKKPILAFEFAKTQQNLDRLFHTVDQNQLIRQLNQLNYLDFLFMLIYGAFLLFFIRESAIKMPVWVKQILFWMIPCTVFFDCIENMHLLQITRHIAYGNESNLYWLRCFTWLKWGCLALIFCGLAFYWLKGPLIFRILGWIGIANIVMGLLALLVGEYWYERFATAISVSFTGAFVFSLLQLLFPGRTGKWWQASYG